MPTADCGFPIARCPLPAAPPDSVAASLRRFLPPPPYPSHRPPSSRITSPLM